MIKDKMTEEERRFQKIHRITCFSAEMIITFRKKDNEIEGDIYNMHIPEPVFFQGIGDMIVKMNRIYDLLGYPQEESQIRKWDDKEKWTGTILDNVCGWNFDTTRERGYEEIDTSSYHVMYVETRFRRNKSWQGLMQIGDRKAVYGSALEFIHCVMGVLEKL